jgi:hypothetical protein
VVTVKDGLAQMNNSPVSDGLTPVITGVADMTVPATSPTGAPVTFSPVVADSDSGLPATLSAFCTIPNFVPDPISGLTFPTVVTSGSTFLMGTTTVTCTAADTGGNLGTKTFDIGVVNFAVPSLTLTTTALNPTNISPIPVTATFSESVTGLEAGEIAVTNGNVANLNGSDAVYTFDVVPLADGEVTINIPADSVQDIAGAGNIATTSLSVIYDHTAPTLEITNGPADTSTITTTETTFEFTATDATTVECKLDAGAFSACVSPMTLSTLSEGTHTFTVKASDVALNSVEVSRTFNVDTLPPTLAEVTPVPSPSNATPSYTFSSSEAGSITYSGNCNSATTAAVSGNNTIVFDTLSGGEHNNCTITVTDGFTHESTPLPVNIFTVDADAPIITLEILPGNVINSASLATAVINYSVTGAGDALCAFDSETPAVCAASPTSPISLSAMAEGTHSFNISATDEVGNTTTQTISFSIDFTAPTLTVNNSATNDTTPTVTGTSNEVATISVLISRIIKDEADENFSQTYSTTSSATAWSLEVPDTLLDGDYDVYAKGTDAAGNESSEAHGTLTINTQLPNLTVDVPVPNSTVITGTTDADAAVTVTVGGFGPYEATGEDTGVWSATITDTSETLGEAIHSVQAIAIDLLGNSAVANTTLTIDVTGPALTLTGSNPTDVNVNGTYEELGATGTDNIDSSVTVSVGGDVVDTSVLNAVYTVRYNALDSSGNIATEITRTVNIKDLEAPVITLNGDSPMNLAKDVPFVDLGATATDNVDASVSVVVGGDTVNTAAVGSYEVTYTATDAASNTVTATRTVVVSDLVVSAEEEIASQTTTDSTTITWTTSHPATSRVVYDTVSHNPITETAPNYGYANSTDETNTNPMVTEHSVTISGLSSGTTYYFRPISHGSPEVVGNEVAVTTATPPPSTPVSSSNSGSSRSGGNRRTIVTTITPTVPATGQVLGASSGFQFTRTLMLGMTGEDVTQLQLRLTSEGVYNGPITGYFGPLTEAGVKAYQTKYGIDSVGIVGPKTRAKLNEGGAVLGAQTQTSGMTIEQMQTLLNQLQAQLKDLLIKQEIILSSK